ncbi:hypothetical protein SEA_SHAGRAT_78 [Rhodococcus phage Shagrat]|nr:hypothetical protein SEA_SHAGRAT_78 [Rhodococcus phage Shagrat]
MADKGYIAQHLTGDTAAFVLEKTDEGVEFDIVTADGSTWEVGEALRQVMSGLNSFMRAQE